MVALPRFRFRSPPVLLLAGAVLLGLVSSGGVSPAAAQGWFGGLFGGGQPQSPYEAPRYPRYGGYGDRPDSSYAPRRRTPRRKAQPVEQAEEPAGKEPAAKPKVPPKTATVFVEVFGDSLGQLLANGLDDALADKTEVGVIHMANGSSGLVNDSYYDWPKAIDDLLSRKNKSDKDRQAQGKPDQGSQGQSPQAQGETPQAQTSQNKDRQAQIDVAVMMIGSNDRQPIVQDGTKLLPGSAEWNTVYRKRVMAIAEAFQRKKIPLVWVGVPIVKNDDFADDMAALNDIYRDAAAKTGATYVDTWEAFSDDNGEFAVYGPDINGQTVRLRTADGIYFTKAGARKLAHFVEAQVRRDLDGKTPMAELPTADAPPSDKNAKGLKETKPGKPAVALVKPEAGPIKNLGELPAAKDGRLTEVTQFRPEAASEEHAASPLAKGQTDPAPAGRADNFRWPSGADPQR